MPTDDLMALEDEALDSSGPRGGRSAVLAGLAFFFALVALALTGLLWWEGYEDSNRPAPELQGRLDNLEQSQRSQAREFAALQSRLQAEPTEDASVDIAAIEATLAEQEAGGRALQRELETQQAYARTLQQALEASQARLMAVEAGLAARAPGHIDAPEQLDLAGVEYLLRLAPERLTLFHDLRSADQALALADAALAGLDNPMYIGLRRHIAEARQALAETALPNSVEISARIDAIQARLPGLDFKGEGQRAEESPGAATTPEQGWWARLKASLASLVTVRRSAADAASRLTFEDRDLLRQGLWMQFEAARLALMRHDEAAWDEALARAGASLELWFSDASAEYAAVRDGLEALTQIEVSPELPDISGPWAQLQLVRQARPAPAPPDVAPSEVPVQEAGVEDGNAGEDEDAGEEAPGVGASDDSQ